MRTPAAIYARVSSDRQREQETIGSQTAATATTPLWAAPSMSIGARDMTSCCYRTSCTISIARAA
jgi:hypothetical protein